MAPDNDPAPEPTIFSAVLTPHRSLSRNGLPDFMLMLGGMSFAPGMAFLMGAWPVFGFFGLDVLLVYGRSAINYRAARAYEQVTVTPSELTVRKVSYRGRVRRMDAQSGLGAARPRVHEEFGIERLFLVSHGRRCRSRASSGAQEKESFAHALSGASARPSAGPTRTVFESDRVIPGDLAAGIGWARHGSAA